MTFLNARTDQFTPRSLQDFILQRTNAIKTARDNLRLAQDYMATYANRSRQDIEFAIGDLVMIHSNAFKTPLERTQTRHKLQDVWHGLYRVEKVVSHVAYKVVLPRALQQVHNVFHVSQMKRFRSRDENPPELDLDSPDLIDEPTDEDVVKVLRTRTIKRGLRDIIQYLIQLRGQTEHDLSLIHI